MPIFPRRIMPAALAALLAGLTFPAVAAAQQATGTWLRETGTSQIRISPCGASLCGRISWLREPNDPDTGKPKTDKFNPDPARRNSPLLGTAVILNMAPAGKPGQWKGQVYKADEGKTYTGFLTVQGADRLLMEGCVMGGVICKKETLSRVR